jgi:hypothetical protein
MRILIGGIPRRIKIACDLRGCGGMEILKALRADKVNLDDRFV